MHRVNSLWHLTRDLFVSWWASKILFFMLKLCSEGYGLYEEGFVQVGNGRLEVECASEA